MLDMYQTPKTLTESKYGWRFDQFKPPFKMDGKKIVDNTGKELAEMKSVEVGREMIQILNDLQKLRDLAEKMATLWR